MKRSPQEKYSLLFEAAKRSLFAGRVIVDRLKSELSAMQSDIHASVDLGERAIPPLITAAAFVDFSHRFCSVVDAMPLINKKAAAPRALREAHKNVEIARNHLQHMRNDLSSNEQIDYPILGSISWVDDDCCYSICPSQPPIAAEYFSIAYNTQGNLWDTTCQYTVKRISIDVPRTLQEMQRTYDWLVSNSDFTDPSVAELSWGQTSALAMRMIINAVG